MDSPEKSNRWLGLILLFGLALRVAYALAQSTDVFINSGGDSGWYLANGWGFFSGLPHGWIRGVPFYLATVPTAPLYLLYAGLWQQFFPDDIAIYVMRLLQCLMGISIAYFAYRITNTISNNQRAGLIASALLAFHPAFIIDCAEIATETMYMFFLAGGLWFYIEWVIAKQSPKISRTMVLVWVGIALGLATLTRAVLLAFPIGLFIHMLMIGWHDEFGKWLKRGLLLLVVYSAVVLIWTSYNLGMWGTFVIGSNQLMPAIWRGAVQNDGSPQENDALLLENPDAVRPDGCEIDCKFQISTETYVEQISESIGGNIGGFIAFRFKELANSYLQPYGTTPLGSVSIRDEFVNWIQNEPSFDGLMHMIKSENFFIKLLIWIFHFGGIFLGIIGMWLTRKQWRFTLPLIGFVVYTSLIHMVLLALPRYIFPTEIVFLIFSASTLVHIQAKFSRRNLANTQHS